MSYKTYAKDIDNFFGTGSTVDESENDAYINYLETYPEEKENVDNMEWTTIGSEEMPDELVFKNESIREFLEYYDNPETINQLDTEVVFVVYYKKIWAIRGIAESPYGTETTDYVIESIDTHGNNINWDGSCRLEAVCSE